MSATPRYARLDIVDYDAVNYGIRRLTRGESAIFTLNFTNKSYTFEGIDQVSFLFQHGTTIYNFAARNYEDQQTLTGPWTLDEHFSYNINTNELTFSLSDTEIISMFEPTNISGIPVAFEIAVGLPPVLEATSGQTIIESKLKLYIVDSIFSQVTQGEITAYQPDGLVVGKNDSILNLKASAPIEITVPTTSAPFLINSDVNVVNLNADLLDGRHSTDFATVTQFNSQLETKVDKVAGKGLSTNDFTDVLKNYVNGLSNTVINMGYVRADSDVYNDTTEILNFVSQVATQCLIASNNQLLRAVYAGKVGTEEQYARPFILLCGYADIRYIDSYTDVAVWYSIYTPGIVTCYNIHKNYNLPAEEVLWEGNASSVSLPYITRNDITKYKSLKIYCASSSYAPCQNSQVLELNSTQMDLISIGDGYGNYQVQFNIITPSYGQNGFTNSCINIKTIVGEGLLIGEVEQSGSIDYFTYWVQKSGASSATLDAWMRPNKLYITKVVRIN